MCSLPFGISFNDSLLTYWISTSIFFTLGSYCCVVVYVEPLAEQLCFNWELVLPPSDSAIVQMGYREMLI